MGVVVLGEGFAAGRVGGGIVVVVVVLYCSFGLCCSSMDMSASWSEVVVEHAMQRYADSRM